MLRKYLPVAALAILLTGCSLPWSRQPTPTVVPVPTATAVPTGTPTRAPIATPPTATPTVPATATPTPIPATPTRAATPATPTAVATVGTPRTATSASPATTPTIGADYTVRDTSGLCQVTLPGNFRDDGGIWRVENEAGATLAGIPTGGFLDFDTATQLLIGNVGGQIGNYRETGRTREASDRLRITYTGQVFGVSGGGIIYQQQFGQSICGLILFAADGQQTRYAPTFERIIASFAAAR